MNTKCMGKKGTKWSFLLFGICNVFFWCGFALWKIFVYFQSLGEFDGNLTALNFINACFLSSASIMSILWGISFIREKITRKAFSKVFLAGFVLLNIFFTVRWMRNVFHVLYLIDLILLGVQMLFLMIFYFTYEWENQMVIGKIAGTLSLIFVLFQIVYDQFLKNWLVIFEFFWLFCVFYAFAGFLIMISSIQYFRSSR